LDLDGIKVGHLDLRFGVDRVELGTKWGHLRMGRGPHQGWTWVKSTSKPKVLGVVVGGGWRSWGSRLDLMGLKVERVGLERVGLKVGSLEGWGLTSTSKPKVVRVGGQKGWVEGLKGLDQVEKNQKK
jgi:hypothetical protein